MHFSIKFEPSTDSKTPNFSYHTSTTSIFSQLNSTILKSYTQKLLVVLLILISVSLFCYNIFLILPYILGDEEKFIPDNLNYDANGKFIQNQVQPIQQERILQIMNDRLEDEENSRNQVLDPDGIAHEFGLDPMGKLQNEKVNSPTQIESNLASKGADSDSNQDSEEEPMLDYAQQKYYPYKLNPFNLCRNPYDNSRESIFLLLVIKSATSQFARRQAIRKTWGDTHKLHLNLEQTGFSSRAMKINMTEMKEMKVEADKKAETDFKKITSQAPSDPEDVSEATEKLQDLKSKYLNEMVLSKNSIPNSNGLVPNYKPIIIKRVFLLADSQNKYYEPLLQEEFNEYHDILQGDFIDSFRNLTLKDIMFLNWQQVYCPSVQFIFKGDDDVFVNIFNVLKYIESQNTETQRNLFTGSVLYPSPRITNPKSKYYVSSNLWSEKYYPPYVSGGGFIMSSYIAAQIFEVMKILPIIPIDDAFVGICLEKIGINPINHKGFKSWGLRRGSKDICVFRDVMTLHKLDPEEMNRSWDLLLESFISPPKQCSQYFDF